VKVSLSNASQILPGKTLHILGTLNVVYFSGGSANEILIPKNSSLANSQLNGNAIFEWEELFDPGVQNNLSLNVAYQRSVFL